MTASKIAPIHWKDICRSLFMTGQMKDFSRAECWRVRKLLMAKVEQGQARVLRVEFIRSNRSYSRYLTGLKPCKDVSRGAVCRADFHP